MQEKSMKRDFEVIYNNIYMQLLYLKSNMKNFFYFLSIFLLLLNSTGALFGSWGMIADPSGESLGWTTDMLRFSPFHNFLMPGLALLVIIGIPSFVTAVVAIKKKANYPMYIVLQGSLLITWIFIQVMMLRFFHVLHFVFGAIGILIIISSIIIQSQDSKKAALQKA
jgi:hypothetical protein